MTHSPASIPNDAGSGTAERADVDPETVKSSILNAPELELAPVPNSLNVIWDAIPVRLTVPEVCEAQDEPLFVPVARLVNDPPSMLYWSAQFDGPVNVL